MARSFRLVPLLAGAMIGALAGDACDRMLDARRHPNARIFAECARAEAASNGAFRIIGRTDGAANPRFEWSGVSVEARFRGSSAVGDLDAGEDAYFQVVVDGTPRARIGGVGGRRKFTLVEGLTDAVHELALFRLTEPNDEGPSTFFGLDAPGGTVATPPRAHSLEVIGDSISCGYGDEDADPCRFHYTTENNYAAYGTVAARVLGADVHTECWSGKGVVRNYDGTMTELLPQLFERAVPSDARSRWDFSFVPDAVIVNLGTNDFQTGDPGRPFVDAYGKFVEGLRSHYPQAFVFLVIAPMLTGNALDRARAYLDDVVQARRAMGDGRVLQIRIEPQDPKNGIGCFAHPSLKTHALMGNAVASAMRRELGW